mgnify:CR=1 FL=1
MPGKTKITAEQSDRIFQEVLDQECEPAVEHGLPGAAQHEFDAGVSGTYNLGARFMGWEWAKLWRVGKKGAAARYLANHYNTAGGKKLPGLVRRRKEEAQLLQFGVYPGVDGATLGAAEGQPRAATPKPGAKPDAVVEEAQRILTARGFNPGAIDGWMGERTRAAILAYQRAHPHLIDDGILGPATLAQLRRDAQAAKEIIIDTVGKGGGGSLAAGALASVAGLPWQWIVPAIIAVALAWAIWRHRDVIARRWNSLIGRTVET